jgi:hypothetical protein
MKLVSVQDHREVARIAGDGRSEYPRVTVADTERGDAIEIRGTVRAAWVRLAGETIYEFAGVTGPDRSGSLSGLFVE